MGDGRWAMGDGRWLSRDESGGEDVESDTHGTKDGIIVHKDVLFLLFLLLFLLFLRRVFEVDVREGDAAWKTHDARVLAEVTAVDGRSSAGDAAI